MRARSPFVEPFQESRRTGQDCCIKGRSRGHETHPFPASSQSLLTSSPTACLGRETQGEVGLAQLYPVLPPEAITAAVDDLTRDRSAMSLRDA